ncbi:MAG: hypothetical protein AAF250_16455 [Pseudomonadota bacterium]
MQSSAFQCAVCGGETVVANGDPAQTLCSRHCTEHDYSYWADPEWHYCGKCGRPAPRAFYLQGVEPGQQQSCAADRLIGLASTV